MRNVLMLALVSMFVTTAVEAKPIEDTKYTYYRVSGQTSADIYDSMVMRGPQVNGVSALASTNFSWLPSGFFEDNGEFCRIDKYKLITEFTIKLPKLRNVSRLKPRLAARWAEFKDFLKTHEEMHTVIWRSCALELERQVTAAKSDDCDAMQTIADKLLEDMRVNCDRRHAEFDAAEKEKLLKHPFMRMVLGKREQKTHALKAN